MIMLLNLEALLSKDKQSPSFMTHWSPFADRSAPSHIVITPAAFATVNASAEVVLVMTRTLVGAYGDSFMAFACFYE